MSKQPEALRLAEQLSDQVEAGDSWSKFRIEEAATEQDAQPAYGAITLALTEKKQ